MSNVFSVSHRDMVMTSKSYSSTKESASGVVYPRFTFSVVLQRQPMYYLTNIALPMMVLTYLGFLSFAVSFDGSRLDTSDRLSITLTLLLTAVAYKFVVASAIPQVSYLTLLDKYISLCFAFLCLIITENALFPFFETRPGWAVTGTHELYVFLGLIGLFTLINLVWFMRFSYKLRCRARLCRDVNVVESVRRLVACSYPEVASQLRWTLVAAVLQRCEVDLRHSEEVQQLLGLAPEVVDAVFAELDRTFSFRMSNKSDWALLKGTGTVGTGDSAGLEEVLQSPRMLHKAVEQVLDRLKDLESRERAERLAQKLSSKRRVL